MWRSNRERKREARSAEVENRGSARDIAFLLAGIGIGSGVALLLAPDSGEETRHAIGRRYRKTVRTIGRHTEDLRERAEDLLERAQVLRERGERLLHLGRGGGETLRRVA